MTKILGGNEFFRIIVSIAGIVPALLVGTASLLSEDFSLDGLIFLSIYLIILFFYLKVNVFDWDVYSNNGVLILRRYFRQEVIYSKVNDMSVNKIFFLSLGLKLYVLNVNGKRFFIKTSQPYSFLTKIFNQKKIINDIKDKLDSGING
jgi:hypothetical protein